MIESAFGLPIKYESWGKQGSLPMYIAESYEFRTAYIAGARCIMITPTDELDTLRALKKQIERIQQVDNVPVVLDLVGISNYRRRSLTENMIPFVTTKQVFLPFIGTMLRNEIEDAGRPEKFVFSTQQLFLFYLYRGEGRMFVSEAGKILPFTAMTLTRAVKQLETTGLFDISKDGVNKVIESKLNFLDLFENARGYLSSPVLKAGYIDKSQVTADMAPAGESALSAKTMLNPSQLATYAVYKKKFGISGLNSEFVDPDNQVRLEVWAYEPRQFSDGENADDISVALSFLGESDERIEEAVSELIKRRLGEG